MKGIGQQFVEYTKQKYKTEDTDQGKGLPQPPLTDPTPTDLPLIQLPNPHTAAVPKVDLFTAINNRVSVRKYSSIPLTLDELSYLLWCTQGIKQVTARPATLRTVPSGGSRHAFETYLLINKVAGLQPGLYKYAALDHCLVQIEQDAAWNAKLTAACMNQGMVKNSAVTFFWIAVAYRTYWRYAERGYRDLFQDIGHVGQNLYLACEAMQAGCCAIGAFDDDVISEYFQLDGAERFPIYVAAVGKKE